MAEPGLAPRGPLLGHTEAPELTAAAGGPTGGGVWPPRPWGRGLHMHQDAFQVSSGLGHLTRHQWPQGGPSHRPRELFPA